MPASVKSYNLLNLWFRLLANLAANNQINSGEEWELNEKRMNEALIYSSATPLDSLEQSLKEDIATLALSCPFVAGQAVYKARRIWSFWQPNALFDDRVLCLQTENKNGEGVIEDIDDYYNLQIVRSHQSEDVINTPSITNEINSIEATRVYPNPAKSNLNIILGRNLPATFVLFNAVGERVLAQPLFESENSMELDKHPAGFYHYLIQYVDGGNETGKLTIQ